jgi:hypothetical protein
MLLISITEEVISKNVFDHSNEFLRYIIFRFRNNEFEFVQLYFELFDFQFDLLI